MVKLDCGEGTDAQLVAGALVDLTRFECIIRRYETRLGRYLRRAGVVCSQDVKDILQNAFIKVFRHLNEYDPEMAFSSWIYRITHNEMVSRWRALRRERDMADPYDDEEVVPEALLDGVTAESDVARREIGAVLNDALMALPEKYRSILVLRFLEDKEYAEISDILRVPMGTVATLINRGRERLRQEVVRRGIQGNGARDVVEGKNQ